jgi:hypothetical protein
MFVILRKEAICPFYAVSYNKENARRRLMKWKI